MSLFDTTDPSDAGTNSPESIRLHPESSVDGSVIETGTSTTSSDEVAVVERKEREHPGKKTLKAFSGSKGGKPCKKSKQLSPHLQHLICMSVVVMLLIVGLATFGSLWSKNNKQDPDCRLCEDGFGLSTPSNILDSPNATAMIQGLTCAQIWDNAENGDYGTSPTGICDAVKAEALAVCECNKDLQSAQQAQEFISSSPSMTPTSSPVTALPTASPTSLNLYVPPNPVPQNRKRSYFNYDLTDNRFGPNGWHRINMDGTYFEEFGANGFGAWDGHLQYHISDPTVNRCSHNGKQSPVDLIRTTWGDSRCTASHQIRTRAGSIPLNDERIKKQILPNKLRILLNRRDCLDLDDRNCQFRPPIADFPNWSSQVTHHSDLMHLDIKLPGEHQIKGETFDAEIQMMHIHLEDSRIAYIGVSIRATADGYNEKYQALLNHFQLVYDQNERECAAKQRRNLRFFDKDKQQSSYLDDPEVQRRLQRRAPFDPFSDFLETIYFYRYNGSSPDPPCFPVTWFFINKPIHIDYFQLRQTQRLLFTHVNGNCEKTSVHNEDQSVVRPIQPLGVVQGTNERRFIMSCMDGSFPPDE